MTVVVLISQKVNIVTTGIIFPINNTGIVSLRIALILSIFLKFLIHRRPDRQRDWAIPEPGVEFIISNLLAHRTNAI